MRESGEPCSVCMRLLSSKVAWNLPAVATVVALPPMSCPLPAFFAGFEPGGDGKIVIIALPTVSPVLSWLPFSSWKSSWSAAISIGWPLGPDFPGLGSCLMRAFLIM